MIFNSRVDGPGRHGEDIRIDTNDRRATRRASQFPLTSALLFYITVN